MPTCPRCGADVTPIRQEVAVVVVGRLVDTESVITGWTCDNDHFLAEREPVDLAAES